MLTTQKSLPLELHYVLLRIGRITIMATGNILNFPETDPDAYKKVLQSILQIIYKAIY
jgi:hypothetical protein